MFGQIEEVYQALQRNGDVEFDWKDSSYTIEPGTDEDGKRYLAIWTAYCDKENYCVYKEETFLEQDIEEEEVVDKVLNAKCFDGKSFIEIANDVEITWIFGID